MPQRAPGSPSRRRSALPLLVAGFALGVLGGAVAGLLRAPRQDLQRGDA